MRTEAFGRKKAEIRRERRWTSTVTEKSSYKGYIQLGKKTKRLRTGGG